MHKRSQLLLAIVGAAMVLAIAVSPAGARRIATSTQQIKATWTGMEFIAEGVTTVRCPVTLEGSLHSRTISKVAEQLIGYITRAFVAEGSCQNGRARALTERLPWHVRYSSFTGTLPNITSIATRVVGAAFLVLSTFSGFQVSCLYLTSATEPNIGTFNVGAGGTVNSVSVSGSIRSQNGFPCPRGSLGGTSNSLTEGNGTTAITVTLVQ